MSFDKYIQRYNHNQSRYKIFPSLQKVISCPFCSQSSPNTSPRKPYDFWLDSHFTYPYFSFIRMLAPSIKTSCALFL